MPDNNAVERAMRSLAIGRKNSLFVGSLIGGRAAGNAYTLIERAKLNGIDPQAWLVVPLACIPDHKITRVDDLLPSHKTSKAVSQDGYFDMALNVTAPLCRLNRAFAALAAQGNHGCPHLEFRTTKTPRPKTVVLPR